jgi:hypothetical protein
VRGLSTVAVVVLLVLAGCSAVPPAGESTPADQLTPAPVPTPPAEERSLAPGLFADGTVDAETLTEAHREALEGRTYTQRIVSEVRAEGGPQLASRRLLVTHGETAYRLGFELTGERRNESRSYQTVAASVWANDSLTVQRITNRANTTDYETVSSRFYREFARPNVRLYAQVLATADTRVVARDAANGTARYHLVATVERAPAAFGLRGAGQTGPATVEAVVRETGLLERVVITYPAGYLGESATLTHTLSVSDVGSTSVERPVWFERAVANG